MNDNQVRDFKGVWIPKEIWLSEELNLQEKCLLVEIDSLSSLGQCFASNDHFAKFLSLSKDRVSKMISGLKSKGFVEVDFTYKNNSKEIDKRIITTMGYRQKQLEGYRQKQLGGVVENNDRGIVKNNEDNNTVFINTVYKNNNSKKSTKTKNVVVSPESQIVIESFKSKYDADLNPKYTQEMIDTKGIEVVTQYLNEYTDYIQGREIKSLGADFYKCVMSGYTKPKGINNKKIPDYANFEQRPFEEDEYEKFYYNLNSTERS
jgi:hypothetical protein